MDFSGGWEGDEVNAFTGKGLSAQEKEAQNYLKKLFNWRKTSTVIHEGKLMHYAPESGIYSYFRYTKKGKVMVISNKNTESIQIKIKRYHEILGNCSIAKDIISGEIFQLNQGIEVSARSAMVLEIK